MMHKTDLTKFWHKYPVPAKAMWHSTHCNAVMGKMTLKQVTAPLTTTPTPLLFPFNVVLSSKKTLSTSWDDVRKMTMVCSAAKTPQEAGGEHLVPATSWNSWSALLPAHLAAETTIRCNATNAAAYFTPVGSQVNSETWTKQGQKQFHVHQERWAQHLLKLTTVNLEKQIHSGRRLESSYKISHCRKTKDILLKA